MRIYLVRHGKAWDRRIDPAQPLSAEGRAEVERVATLLGRAGIRVPRVVHSGKARAAETAGILAAAVSPGKEPEERKGLAPLDPCAEWVLELRLIEEDQMLVGHLPFLDRLLGLLVTGREEPSLALFEAGSVFCLERGEGDRWRILWAVSPAVAT